MACKLILPLTLCLIIFTCCLAQATDFVNGQPGDYLTASELNDLFQIEGKVISHDGFPLSNQFLVDTKIIVNYGQYFGFLK